MCSFDGGFPSLARARLNPACLLLSLGSSMGISVHERGLAKLPVKVNSSVRLRSVWLRRGGKAEVPGCGERPEEGVAMEGELDADEADGMDGEKEGADEDTPSQLCECEDEDNAGLGGREEK